MKRRQFLTKGTIGMASLGIMAHVPNNLFATTYGKLVTMPIGFQSYVLREDIGKDLTGTLKKMAEMGYEYVEMCSPKGYMGPFEPLVKYSGAELKTMIADTGMKCNSSHFTFGELKDSLDERIEFAQQMELDYMILAFGLNAATPDELKENCAALNRIGETVKKGGMITGFHNHAIEFEHKFHDKLVYDIIMEELDPELVKMQYQTQPITLGVQGSKYFNKYPGRFISAHLQDYSKADKTKEIPIGQGIADWNDFFAAAEKGGVRIVYVEMDSNPTGVFEDSITYLKNL